MNLKYKILTFSLLMSGLGFTSCDDFLTQENEHQLTTQKFYKDLGDCENGLAAIYNAFKNTNIYQPMDENLRSDLAVEANKNRINLVNAAYLQNFNDSYQTLRNKWAALYTGVFRCNQVIEGVEKVRTILTDEVQLVKLTQIEAQAYFFRGVFFFYLNTSFNNGNVPYIDYVPEEEDDYYKKCTPSDEVKKYYRADLQKALDLGLNGEWKEADKGRATSWAAKDVLGKSYLYDGDYDKAAEYFSDIINNGPFTLVDNIMDNFTAVNEFNSESILEVSYSTQYNTQYGPWSDATLYNIWGMNVCGSSTSWINTSPSLWLVEKFENEAVDENDPRNWIEVESDNYPLTAPNNQKDIIYDQLGQTFNSVIERNGKKYNKTYVYHYENGKYVGVRQRLIPVDGIGNVDYGKLSDIYSEPEHERKFKWENGKPYRLRAYSLRASASLAINGDEDLSYYEKTTQQVGKFNNGITAYFRKLTNWDSRKDEADFKPAMASGINYRLIRLADIYLMYAECLIKGGTSESNLQNAINFINRVRKRSGIILIGKQNLGEYPEATYDDRDLNSNDVMQHLMYIERPMELCMEGHAIRVIDLRRWNVTKERFTWLSKQKYLIGRGTFLAPTKEDPNSLYVGQNWGKQRPYRADDPDTYLKPVSDYIQASMNYGPSVAYWPIPNIESTSNPDINN